MEDNSINKETFVFSSEKIMLEEFINFIYKKDPIMLVSWFGDSFYFPYLINRCKNLNVDYLKLSPFEKFKTKKVYIFDKQINIEVPIGRYFIDYKTLLEAYKKNKIDSYELITVSNNEFKENKHKCLNLEELFENGSNEYVDKVFFNVETLNRLDNKLNYIKTMIEEAWTMGINFDDVFSTIKPWTFKLYNELKKEVLDNESQREFPHHLAPSLMISGKGNIHSERIKKSLEGRYRINLLYDLFEHGLRSFSIYNSKHLKQIGSLNPKMFDAIIVAQEIEEDDFKMEMQELGEDELNNSINQNVLI